MDQRINVLDKGYIRLVDTNLTKAVMGTDLSSVNAARASFMKESNELNEKDIRLIKFLAEHGHQSPFRHATIALEYKAPLMVARQLFKYRVGHTHSPDNAELLGFCVPEEISNTFWKYVEDVLGFVGIGDDSGFFDLMYARNEASRRYVTLEPEFYFPSVWRSAPENKKQGSGAEVEEEIGDTADYLLGEIVNVGLKSYVWALERGICAEQARLFLPMYGLYTVWRHTSSVQGLAHLFNQRLGEDAQSETKEYAEAAYKLTYPLFQHSLSQLVKKEIE